MFSRQYHNQAINDFSRALQDVITVLSLIVNTMLLRIVSTSSHRREIGFYRYLIASFAVSDLIYTSVHFLVYPIPEMHGNAFLLSGHGIFNTRLGASIYCGVYSQATPILVSHFVYRTLNIRNSIHSLPTILFSAMITATVSMNLNGFFVMYYLFRPDEETLTKIAPYFAGNISSPVIHHYKSAAEHIQALYWSDKPFSRPRWRNLLGAFDAMFTIAVTYTIIIVCACLINRYLREHAARSSKTLCLHRQLYRSLLCQAVYPAISTYFPLGVCMFLPIFGINFDWVAIFCPTLCVSHPLFDALILIFCMTEYRLMFLRSLGLAKCTRRRRRSVLPLSTMKTSR